MSAAPNLCDLFYDDDWDAIEQLARKRPKILHKPFQHADTPLHDLIRRSGPDPNEGIRRILQMDPSTARDKTGFYAESYEFASENYSSGVMDNLYGTGNEVVIPGSGLLPVHLAVMNDTITLDTLKLVVQAYPEGLLVADTHGNTPMHYSFLWWSSITEEKRQYLVQANGAAAAVTSFNGSFPLHYAAEYGKAKPETVRALFEAHPAAISQKNVHGKLPLELAVQKKHRELARLLRELDPSAPKKPESKASCWVKEKYGERFVSSRLKVATSQEQTNSGQDGDRKMPASLAGHLKTCPDRARFDKNDKDRKTPEALGSETLHAGPLKSAAAQRRPNDAQEEEDRKMSAVEPKKLRPLGQSTAEKAISLVMGWLSSPKELRAIGLVSKSLRQASSKSYLWDGILKDLEKDVPLHSKDVFANEESFPVEFIDPRHTQEYASLNSFNKATFLSQYRTMVLAFFRDDMDQAGIARMEEIVEGVRDTVRQADGHGFFDDADDDWDEDDEDAGPWKPANVQEALAGCTLKAVKDYCVKKCVDGFVSNGISGVGAQVVMDCWEGIDFGGRHDSGWIFLCADIGGLDVVEHGWHGLYNW